MPLCKPRAEPVTPWQVVACQTLYDAPCGSASPAASFYARLVNMSAQTLGRLTPMRSGIRWNSVTRNATRNSGEYRYLMRPAGFPGFGGGVGLDPAQGAG